MATSFICEHTAEFYLVPSLKRILEREFKYVTPIFPWLSRELSSISRQLHFEDDFFVLAMFARRPKIFNGNIYVTINEELKIFQEIGSRHNVPVIAGCPNSNDFWELAKCEDFIWLNIAKQNSFDYLIPTKSLETGFQNFRINDDKIISIVKESGVHKIDTLENFIREVRFAQPQVIFYGARYKPVYFLIKEH